MDLSVTRSFMFASQFPDAFLEILIFIKEFESVSKAGSRYFQKTTGFSFAKFWFDEHDRFLFLLPAYHFFSSNILIIPIKNGTPQMNKIVW